MKRRTLLASSAMAFGLAATLGTAALAQDPMKVGFIYVGPVGDFGWTTAHDVARQAAQEHFGDAIETVFVESVPEGADFGPRHDADGAVRR